MKRRLYRGLIGLHPREFRERFGDEMLAVFEQAGETTALLVDACWSVLRQRVLRGGLWRIGPMVVLTVVPWLSLTWALAPVPTRRPHPVALADLYLIAGVVAVLTAALTTVFALTWHRIRRPGRRKHA